MSDRRTTAILRARFCCSRVEEWGERLSGLNQVEIYFSVVQSKVLTPNDFNSLTRLRDRLLLFQGHYDQVAKPFQWKFTRRDLQQLMAKLSEEEDDRKAA